MNIDQNIVTRALEKAGQEPLTQEDIEKNSSRWRLIKSFYLPTILETLSKTSWTSRKKRAHLSAYTGDNDSSYSYAYFLPLDCAKPDMLLDNQEYEVEGNVLYTDVEDPVLLYVSNGYTGLVKKYETADPQPTEENFASGTYYIMNASLNAEAASSYSADTIYYVEIENTDDYPEYDTITFEPLLSEYIETRLAAKIVLKITGNQQLYQLLYGESQLLERSAVDATMAHSHSRENGEDWWATQLGLSDD